MTRGQRGTRRAVKESPLPFVSLLQRCAVSRAHPSPAQAPQTLVTLQASRLTLTLTQHTLTSLCLGALHTRLLSFPPTSPESSGTGLSPEIRRETETRSHCRSCHSLLSQQASQKHPSPKQPLPRTTSDLKTGDSQQGTLSPVPCDRPALAQPSQAHSTGKLSPGHREEMQAR